MKKWRERDRRRLHANERDTRLQLMRTRQSERLAAETTTDRDARLQQMSARQCELRLYHNMYNPHIFI